MAIAMDIMTVTTTIGVTEEDITDTITIGPMIHGFMAMVGMAGTTAGIVAGTAVGIEDGMSDGTVGTAGMLDIHGGILTGVTLIGEILMDGTITTVGITEHTVGTLGAMVGIPEVGIATITQEVVGMVTTGDTMETIVIAGEEQEDGVLKDIIVLDRLQPELQTATVTIVQQTVQDNV